MHVSQSSPSDTVIGALISKARIGADAFRDRNAAIAAGYRLLGMDFPSMGEHWVSPRLVIEGHFDIGRPAMLTYITVGDKPVLAGVVYAIPLSQGETPPADFGAGAMWHEHNGTVDEESLIPVHDGSVPDATGTRLAVLHAWVSVPNPGGLFAAENWALPFVRLGLSPPDDFPAGAARAISLLSGGSQYYLGLAETGGAGAPALADALSECTTTASRIVMQARAAGRGLTSVDLGQLDEAWTKAVRRVGQFSNAEAAKRINGGALPRAF